MNLRREIKAHEPVLGDAATWRLIIVREKFTSVHGFEGERAARAGAVAYMNDPDVRAVMIEPIEAAA